MGEENKISVFTIHVQCWGARGDDRSLQRSHCIGGLTVTGVTVIVEESLHYDAL